MPTPDEWRDKLYPLVVKRAPKLQVHEDFYRGKHPLPFLTEAHADKMRNSFRQMLDESQTNFMRLIIDTVKERLRIEGIRLSASSDPQSDKESWDIWQANQMDNLHSDAILDSLIKGISYLSVWEDTNGDGYPDMAVEDARETIVAYTPGTNFRRRDAALKTWRDEVQEEERATLYLPDRVYRYFRPLVTIPNTSDNPFQVQTTTQNGADGGWKPVEDGEREFPNPLGVVPIIPLRNRGRLLVEGESEIADSTTTQMQINSMLFLLALAGYFGAHKQRWATGLTLVDDDDTGEVKEPFDVAIDKMLVSEDETVKFGEFAESNLDGYIKVIDQKAVHLAIKHRLPKHYFLPEGQSPSGDSIQSSESGLIRLASDKASRYDDGFEEAMRLARKLKTGSDTPVDSEMVWSDPSTASEATRTDAVIKKFQAGLIPREQALEDIGYSQTQIARIMTTSTTEDILKSIAGSDAVNPTPPAKPANGQ